jgi:hypothetical protein
VKNYDLKTIGSILKNQAKLPVINFVFTIFLDAKPEQHLPGILFLCEFNHENTNY